MQGVASCVGFVLVNSIRKNNKICLYAIMKLQVIMF